MLRIYTMLYDGQPSATVNEHHNYVAPKHERPLASPYSHAQVTAHCLADRVCCCQCILNWQNQKSRNKHFTLKLGSHPGLSSHNGSSMCRNALSTFCFDNYSAFGVVLLPITFPIWINHCSNTFKMPYT